MRVVGSLGHDKDGKVDEENLFVEGILKEFDVEKRHG